MKVLPIIFLLLVFIVSGCSKSTSLSDCPDCGQTVSVRASECPHCGGPLSQDVTLNIVDRAWSSDVDPDGNPVRLHFHLTSSYPDPPDPLTTADFEGINRLSTVRALWLDYGVFQSGTLSPLTTNNSLISLSFNQCSLSINDFRQIARIPNLIYVLFLDCDFVPQSLAELSNSKSLRDIKIKGGDDNGKVELNLSILKKLSHIRTIASMEFWECIFPSYWEPAFTDGFQNLVDVELWDCNLTDEEVREMLIKREGNNLGGIDWQHDFKYVVDREYRYDWDQAAMSIIEADIEGHSNWWAWFLGVFVVGGISVGWWRIKLRTKTSDSIEEQISDLNEESST